MTEKFDTHGWYQELSMLGKEAEYEAFLRRRSIAGDHSFLLASISRSNLNAAVRNVVEDFRKDTPSETQAPAIIIRDPANWPAPSPVRVGYRGSWLPQA